MLLRLAPSPESVRTARHAVCEFADATGMCQNRRDDIALAVSEAVTNAIAAHREAGCEEEIAVRARLDGGRCLELTVVDAGIGFEPRPAGENGQGARPLHDASEGGYGLSVIRGLADQVDFERRDGTAVRMAFFL